MEFRDKKVAVVGAGVEGMSSAKFLAKRGAKVTVLDRREIGEVGDNKSKIKDQRSKISFKCGKDYLEDLDKYNLIVRSPGVKRNIAEIVQAEKNGVEVTSQTKIFFDLCPCPIIGVTGTKGKGTTASLIYEMLKVQNLDVYLGGNIGTPPLDFLDKVKKDSWVVLELSSFQLLDLTFQSQKAPAGLLKETPFDLRSGSHLSQTATSEVNFGKPHIAVMLMIVPEHLNYHSDVDEYVNAKRNILKFQTSSDFAILNRDYIATNESDIHTEGKALYVSREREVEEGCFAKDGKIVVRTRGFGSFSHVANDARYSHSEIQNQTRSLSENRPQTNSLLQDKFSSVFSSFASEKTSSAESLEEVIAVKEILLPGKHNLENVCAAVMAATLVGVEKVNIVKVLKTFEGLEHRLELVGEVNGVKYYDDSFSTTPETAIAAIQSFKQPEILILGGSSKGSDFTELGKVISEAKNIKAIIGIGEEWSKIRSKIKDQRSKIRINEKAKHLGGVMASPSTPLGISLPPSEVNGQFSIYGGLKDMHEIVQKASSIAQAGDIVLLSPACASFGMFKNYKDRGEQFKKEIQRLSF